MDGVGKTGGICTDHITTAGDTGITCVTADGACVTCCLCSATDDGSAVGGLDSVAFIINIVGIIAQHNIGLAHIGLGLNVQRVACGITGGGFHSCAVQIDTDIVVDTHGTQSTGGTGCAGNTADASGNSNVTIGSIGVFAVSDETDSQVAFHSADGDIHGSENGILDGGDHTGNGAVCGSGRNLAVDHHFNTGAAGEGGILCGTCQTAGILGGSRHRIQRHADLIGSQVSCLANKAACIIGSICGKVLVNP